MLAVAVWTGAGDAYDWQNPANWALEGALPQAGDDVVFDESGAYVSTPGGQEVVFTGDATVASLTATATGLTFSSGTLTVAGAMTISRPGPNWRLIMQSGATVQAGSITATNVILGSEAGSNLLSSGAISISGNNVQTVFGTVYGLGGVTLDGDTGNALGMGATGVINGGSGGVTIGANGQGYADVGGTLIGNVITINTSETALNSAVVNAASNLVFNVPNAITAVGFPGMSINTPLITLAGAGGVGAAGSLVIGGSNNQIGGVTGAVGAISLSTSATLGVSSLTLTGTAGFSSPNGAAINLLGVTGFTTLGIASEGAVQIAGTVSGDSVSIVAPAVGVVGANVSLTGNLYVETADGLLLSSVVGTPLMEFVGAVESNGSTLTAATRLRLNGTFQQVGGSIITARVEMMGGTGMVYRLSSPDNEIAVFAGDLDPNHSYIDSGSVATIGDLVIEGFAGGALDVSARSVAQSDRLSVQVLKVRAETSVLLDNALNDIGAVSVLPRVGELASVVLASNLAGGTSLVVDQDNHGIRAGFVRLIAPDFGGGFSSPGGSNFGAIVADTLFLEGAGSFNLESDANAVGELHAAVGGSVVYRSGVQGVDLVPRGVDPFSVAGNLTISVIGNELAIGTDVSVGGTMLLSANHITQGGAITAGITAIGTGSDTTLTVQTNSFNGFVDGNLNLTLIPYTDPDGVALDAYGGGGFGLLTFGNATITVPGASLFINAGINTNGNDLTINALGLTYAASPFNFLLSPNLALNLTSVGITSVLQGGDINVASLSGVVAGTLYLQDVDGLTLGRAGSGFTAPILYLSTLAVNQPADVLQSGPLTVGALVLSLEGGANLTDAGNSVGSITGNVFDVFRYGSDTPGALVLNLGSASTIGVGVNLTNALSSLDVFYAQGSAGVDLRAGSISGGSIMGDQVGLVASSGGINVSGVQANKLAALAPLNITIVAPYNTQIDTASLSFAAGAVVGIVAGGDVSLTFAASSAIQSRLIAQNLWITMLAGNLTTLPVATVAVPGQTNIQGAAGTGVFLDDGAVNLSSVAADAAGGAIGLFDVDSIYVSFARAQDFTLRTIGGTVVGDITASRAATLEAGVGPLGGTLQIFGTISAPTVSLAVAADAGNGSLTLSPGQVVSDVLSVNAADLTILGSSEFGQISASGNVHLFENSRVTVRTHAYFNAPGSVLTVLGNAGLYAGANTSDSSININRIESAMSFDGGTLDLFTRGILRITGGTIGQPSVLNGDLLIRANNVQLDGYLTSTNNRTLFLGTYSDGIDIKLGDDSFGPPFLGLTAAEVANIGPGFGSVQVGGGRINFLGDTTWNSPTVFTPSSLQDIVSYGATVRSANGAALTFNTSNGARFVVNGATTSIVATGNVSFNGPVVLDGALNVDSSGATGPNLVRFAADINGFHAFGEIPALYVRPGFSTATQFLGSIGNTESVDVVEVGTAGGGLATPIRVATSGALAGTAVAVNSAGTVVFTGIQRGLGVRVTAADVSNPANPTPMGFVDVDFGVIAGVQAMDFQESRGLLFVRTTSGVAIVDVSDPAAPVLRGVANPANDVYGGQMAAYGNYLYFGSYASDGIQVFDTSDPSNPVALPSIPTGFGPTAMTISGGYLFVGEWGPRRVGSYNLSNPASPTLIDMLPVSGSGYFVANGAALYLTDGGTGLISAIDASDPANLAVVGFATTLGVAGHLAVANNRLYANSGVFDALPTEVFDITTPAGIRRIGSTGTGLLTTNQPYLAAVGDTLFVGHTYTNDGVFTALRLNQTPTVEFGEAGEQPTPRTISGGFAGALRLDANVVVHSGLSVDVGNGGAVRIGGDLSLDATMGVLSGSLTVLGTLSGTPASGGAAQFYATVVGAGSSIRGNVSGLATIQLSNYGGADFGLPAVVQTDSNVLFGAFSAGASGLHLIGTFNSVGGSVSSAGPIIIDGYTFIGIGGQTQPTTLSPGGDLVFNSDVRLLVGLNIDMTGAPSDALVRFGGAVDSYAPGFPQSLSVVQGNDGVVRFEQSVGTYAALGSIGIAPVPPPDFNDLPMVEFGTPGGGAGITINAASVSLVDRVRAYTDLALSVGNVFVLGRVIGSGTNALTVQADNATLLDGIDGFGTAVLGASGTFQIGYNVAATALVLTGNFVELNGVGVLFRAGSINLNGASISSSGDITFDGAVSLSADSEASVSVGRTVAFLSTVALNGFHFIISGDEINFFGKVSGPGTLDLRQATPGITINFVYTPTIRASLLGDPGTDPVPGELDITPTEYSLFDPTISVVVVGSSGGSPVVEIGEVNLTSTTTVNAAGSGGKVRVRGDVRGTGGSGVTINGSFTTTELYASIMLSGGGLVINDAVKVFAPAARLTTNEGAPGGAPLLIVGGVNSQTGMTNALQVAAGASTVALQGAVGAAPGGLLGSLAVQAGNTTISGNQVSTSGPQVYDTPVVVQGGVTISTIGAPVNFNNAVTGGGAADLTVAPGTGEVTFAGTVTLASVEINTGNNRTFSAPVVIGVLDVLGGEVAFNAPATILAGSFSGGSITGSGDVVISGLFTWSGGTFSGSGGVMVAASGELAIVHGGFKSLERMLVNGGLVSWQSGNVSVNGATLTNQGEFRISADGGTLSGSGSIDNTAGIIRRAGNDGTSTIEGLIVLNGTGGQVIVEQGVLLILPPAPPARTGEAFVRGAGQTLLINDGQIVVGPRGTLRLAGDFGQRGSGAIVALIDGPSSFGQIAVDGTATIDGVLELRYVNGYNPANLDPFAAARWTVLVAGQVVGRFARIDSPALPPRRVLYATYTGGGVEFLYTHISDVNRDGLLNPDDLGDFITEYFTPEEFLDPNSKIDRDFNRDGVVNSDDLGDFIMNYYADYLRP